MIIGNPTKEELLKLGGLSAIGAVVFAIVSIYMAFFTNYSSWAPVLFTLFLNWVQSSASKRLQL